MEKKPHFTIVEIVFGVLVSIYIFDELILAAEALPIIGGWLVGMAVWLLYEAYFHFKGVKRADGKVLSSILKKLGWQIIPCANTVMFIMTAVKTNREISAEQIEKGVKKLEKVGEKTKKLAGKLGIGKLAKGAG